MKEADVFTVPEYWEEFYDEVIENSKNLIKLGYWDNISEVKLDNWLNNFKTEEEQYLSVLLLHKLIFRNNKSILAMYQQIIQVILPDILKQLGIIIIDDIEDWSNQLNRKPTLTKLPIRFSAIENVDCKPGKSGSSIYREFQRNGRFHKDLGVSVGCLGSLTKEVKTVVFFDDVAGSGKQFCKFMKNHHIEDYDFKVIYCPLAAHTKALVEIDKKYPNVIVAPVEVLDKDLAFFKQTGTTIDGVNTVADLKSFYLTFLKSESLDIPKNIALGYGKLELLYFFSQSTPNNTLPLLWHNEPGVWECLFSR